MGTCRSCGEPIWWAFTTGGKRIPMDPIPNPMSNLVMVTNDGQAVVGAIARDTVRELTKRDTKRVPTVAVARRGARSVRDVPHWRTHFQTCPDATSHRRRPSSLDSKTSTTTPERLFSDSSEGPRPPSGPRLGAPTRTPRVPAPPSAVPVAPPSTTPARPPDTSPTPTAGSAPHA